MHGPLSVLRSPGSHTCLMSLLLLLLLLGVVVVLLPVAAAARFRGSLLQQPQGSLLLGPPHPHTPVLGPELPHCR
jgi:hypothetical protein